ncbi:MAG: GNAT family N-acetyltransferase [Ktedonobacteraceae bacterium]|nr:GNAT family N-acetyltransferase [Ktedonobacteraceae bacterium]
MKGRYPILQFGFDSCRLHRIEAQVALPNHASAQVLRKLGFQEEGLLRERLYVDNQFYDEKMFALLNKRYCQQSNTDQQISFRNR